MERCSSIRDAWRIFVEAHGSVHPIRTEEELRDYIHARGLRYEDLDESFWDELYDSPWILGED